MKVTAIVQARMNSTRLPGKVLRKVNGKPLIEYLIDRLTVSKEISGIMVATSDQKTDDSIYKYCFKNNVDCFRGNLNNVAKRFYNLLDENNVEHFIRICADSPLIDSKLIDDGIALYKKSNYDILTNTFERTFPKGQSFEIVNSDLFKENFYNIKDAEDLEHVTSFYYKNHESFNIYNYKHPGHNFSNINLSVDTQDDLKKFAKIVKGMNGFHTAYDWKSIVNVCLNL